jgi:hypothetical protein
LFILAGLVVAVTLLFPSATVCGPYPRSTQAKNDATQIATAISAYLSEYGRLPISSPVDVTVSEKAQSGIMDLLCPESHPFPALNSRGIVFLEIPNASKGRNGRLKGKGPYLDPWGNPYFITLDSNYDGVVSAPGDTSAPPIKKSVIVWSRGDPDKDGYNKPEKWVKSWE